jgi:hypothetical protein
MIPAVWELLPGFWQISFSWTLRSVWAVFQVKSDFFRCRISFSESTQSKPIIIGFFIMNFVNCPHPSSYIMLIVIHQGWATLSSWNIYLNVLINSLTKLLEIAKNSIFQLYYWLLYSNSHFLWFWRRRRFLWYFTSFKKMRFIILMFF